MEERNYSKEEIKEIKKVQKNLTNDIQLLERRITVSEKDIDDIKEELRSIMSNTMWILRIVIASIITALLMLLFKGGM
ncbi:hemolysin XhlA family protein [Ectobacillus panaciterrae]|uniref:hemolysin XhlA family protein n=1 Tax=Ectobacillus panaciterrae TaxID=363872 RepID=UPI00048D2ADF|nr:hemolysin XhlA family protein [Ectobacillus panaciterrae]